VLATEAMPSQGEELVSEVIASVFERKPRGSVSREDVLAPPQPSQGEELVSEVIAPPQPSQGEELVSEVIASVFERKPRGSVSREDVLAPPQPTPAFDEEFDEQDPTMLSDGGEDYFETLNMPVEFPGSSPPAGHLSNPSVTSCAASALSTESAEEVQRRTDRRNRMLGKTAQGPARPTRAAAPVPVPATAPVPTPSTAPQRQWVELRVVATAEGALVEIELPEEEREESAEEAQQSTDRRNRMLGKASAQPPAEAAPASTTTRHRRGAGRTSPPKVERSSPPKVERASTTGRSSPTKAGRASPSKAGRSSPVKAGRSSPTKAGRSSPVKAGRSSPTKAGRSSPTKAGRSSPTKAGRASPSRAAGIPPKATLPPPPQIHTPLTSWTPASSPRASSPPPAESALNLEATAVSEAVEVKAAEAMEVKAAEAMEVKAAEAMEEAIPAVVAEAVEEVSATAAEGNFGSMSAAGMEEEETSSDELDEDSPPTPLPPTPPPHSALAPLLPHPPPALLLLAAPTRRPTDKSAEQSVDRVMGRLTRGYSSVALRRGGLPERISATVPSPPADLSSRLAESHSKLPLPPQLHEWEQRLWRPVLRSTGEQRHNRRLARRDGRALAQLAVPVLARELQADAVRSCPRRAPVALPAVSSLETEAARRREAERAAWAQAQDRLEQAEREQAQRSAIEASQQALLQQQREHHAQFWKSRPGPGCAPARPTASPPPWVAGYHATACIERRNERALPYPNPKTLPQL